MRPFAIIRTILVIAAIFAAAMLLPARADWQISAAFLAAIFAASIMAPAAIQTYLRRNRIRATISVELMKIRRLYHLSRHLAEHHEPFRPWFTELHSKLYDYLSFFGSKKYAGYGSSDQAFRQVSYHIYAIPEDLTDKQQLLYSELLDTVADAASAREQLKSLLVDHLPKSEVTALGFGVGVALCAIVSSVGVEPWSRTLAAFLAFAVYLGYERIVEIDSLCDIIPSMPKRYSYNLARLEYRNRDEEK